MFIEQIDNNKIKVTVGKEEQMEYGITYESMNYSDSNTRKLCEDIMEQAHSEVGFNVGDSKLLVEAKLSANGAVTLYLSKVPCPHFKEKEELFGQMLEFDKTDAILDCVGCFSGRTDKLCLSNLYYYKNKYYLYFEILSTHTEAKNLLRNLLEYSARTKFTKEYLDEYGEIITEQIEIDAIREGTHKHTQN